MQILDDHATNTGLIGFDDSKNQIIFSIIKKDIVNISLFNRNGEKIFNLLNEKLSPGVYGVRVNMNKLLPGKYFYKFTTPQFSEMNSFLISTSSLLMD